MYIRRSKEQLDSESDQILRILKRDGAKRVEELAEIMDVPSRRLERPLKMLKRDGKVTVAGNKRWTYYAYR